MSVRKLSGLVAAPIAGSVLLLGCVVFVPLVAASGGSAPSVEGLPASIPPRALEAYRAADGWCPGLRWQLVAAIGEIETGHGGHGGGSIDEDGLVSPRIFGPPLDGSGGSRHLPIGRWLGWWGLAGPWQQSVGPMQFLAGTFTAWAVDGDGDGMANPHDIDDAVASAANYLCGEAGVDDERVAVLRYNSSAAYVDQVIAAANRIADSTFAAGAGWMCPVAGAVSFTDTWGAPRSGGRVHRGVDMFATYGTPVVAPVAGTVEYRPNIVGGLSFHLWSDDGNYYYGSHLSRYGEASGQVRAGMIVGYVGATGNAAGTPPHLHFEIHPSRRPGDPPAAVNPTSTVAAACASNRVGVVIDGRD